MIEAAYKAVIQASSLGVAGEVLLASPWGPALALAEEEPFHNKDPNPVQVDSSPE